MMAEVLHDPLREVLRYFKKHKVTLIVVNSERKDAAVFAAAVLIACAVEGDMVAWHIYDDLVLEAGALLDIDSVADALLVFVGAAQDHYAVEDWRHQRVLSDQWLEGRQMDHCPLSIEALGLLADYWCCKVDELTGVIVAVSACNIDYALKGASGVKHARSIQVRHASVEPILVV